MPDFDWSRAAEPAVQPEQAASAFDWATAAEPAQREISKQEEPGIFTADNAKRAANALIRAESMMLGPLGLAAPQFEVAPMEATGKGTAAIRGAQQGASMGFADEDAGARAAAQELVSGGGLKQAMAKYRAARDAERGSDERAKQVAPDYYTGGEIAGAIATPVPFGKAKAAKNAGRLLKLARAAQEGAALGGAYGLGSSDADLTRGEVGHAAVDTIGGAAVGGAGGAIGEGIAQGVGKVLKKASTRALRGIEEANAAELAAQTAKKAKLERSATGALGGESAAAIKTLERLEEAANNTALSEAERKQAADLLASPEMQALKAKALRNYIEKAPDQMGRIKSAEQALSDARAVDVNQAADEAMQNPVKRHVLPRAITLGNRYMPALAGALGYAIAGPEGAAVGGALGTIQSLTQGAPGRALKNMIEKPAVRRAFWEKVLAASGGSPSVTAAIPKLEQAAARGEKALSSVLAVLSEQSPDFRAAMRRVAGVEQPRGDELAAR